MATLVSEPNIRPLINFPIMIDQQFDLDEVLTLAKMPIQYDRDHHQVEATNQEATSTQSPDYNLSTAASTAAAAGVDSCAVCMERFNAGECREPIPCGHVYHAGCIATWLSVCSSCPLCRRRVSGANQFSSAGKQ